MKMVKHFVTFLSPGTLVSEATTRPIDKWDVPVAVAMSRAILEWHNAKPYGFYFTTRMRGDADFDSEETARSGIYYLGGRIETKAEVFARNDPKEHILRCNMEDNGIERIITNDNSWRFTAPLNADDVVLDYDSNATAP